jgi:putative heme-binding domain-containing protein
MQQLARVKNAALKERAAKLIAANRPADRGKVIEKYQPALSRKGDPAHGRELFSKTCAQCHRIGGIGVNVAPDISDSRVKLPSQLLTDILDPNRAIDNNYFNYLVVDRDGTTHTGVIATETSTSVTLRQPEDKRITIARENIEQIRSTGQSLMPVGLEKTLSIEDMSDLISFIKNWRYLGGEVPKEVIR